MGDPPLQLDEEQYLAIEDALMATPRGRAFLRERDARGSRVALDVLRAELRGIKRFMRRALVEKAQNEHQLKVLSEELREMSECIQQTLREIAEIRPRGEAGHNDWIHSATEQLDAIVSATEQATSDILQAAEELQSLVTNAAEPVNPALRKDIEARITSILTACSFQDITGQRTTKVINALKFLEQRISKMIEIWGGQIGEASGAMVAVDQRPDAHLLNGPALRGGVSQDQVDELLSVIAPGAAATPPADQASIDALFD
jgi:chemotaxis regulatin CheY-phosphate phosphatase CheZ